MSMRFGHYQMPRGNRKPIDVYEAHADGKLKGEVHVMAGRVDERIDYPVHPSFREHMDTEYTSRYAGSQPGVMNGLRGESQADGDYRMQSYDDEWARNTTEAGKTIPLFQHSARSRPATVDYLRTTRGARAVAGPLLGIAAVHQMDQGVALTPSGDLSPHSAPLVGHVNRALGTQFKATQSNGMGFDDAANENRFGLGIPRTPHSESGYEFSRDEVNRGRNFMRRALRRTPAVPDHGYAQTTIFDHGA